MRLSQLEYFLTVAKMGGVSAAARELHISQPAITTAIRSLEQELGVTLFDRVKQRIVLTPQGGLFYERLSAIQDALQSAIAETRSMGTRRGAVIRLGLPAMIGLLYTYPILHDFSKQHPELELHIVEANTRELRGMFTDGLIDMALMIGESPYSKGLGRKVLLNTQYSFFLGRNHPLTQKGPLSLETVASLPLMLFDQGLFLNQYITDAMKQRDLEPNIIFASSQISSIKYQVGENLAGTFLIRECVSDEDGLVEVPTEVTPQISIVAAWPRRQPLTDEKATLLRYLQKLI